MRCIGMRLDSTVVAQEFRLGVVPIRDDADASIPKTSYHEELSSLQKVWRIIAVGRYMATKSF